MDNFIFETAKAVRKKLEKKYGKNDKFDPCGYCFIATVELYKALPKEYDPLIAVTEDIDEICTHVFLFLNKPGIVVDITVDQFTDEYGKIAIEENFEFVKYWQGDLFLTDLEQAKEYSLYWPVEQRPKF